MAPVGATGRHPRNAGPAERSPVWLRLAISKDLLKPTSDTLVVLRSEWKVTPAGGRRDSNAVSKASEISSVRMRSASAQPATRRLARPITVARYAHPPQVAM